MTQRCVENTATTVEPGPGDRLGVAGNGAGEENLGIFGQTTVLVKTAGGLKRLYVCQDGMVFGLGFDVHLDRRAAAVMTLVVSTQHLLVQGQPILKSVTGGANADDRLARLAILLDLFQL